MRAYAVQQAEARDKAMAMLEAVNIRNPRRVFELLPHEVSGGMGQRIMFAMMLILEPDLIIADERPRHSTSPCGGRCCPSSTSW